MKCRKLPTYESLSNGYYVPLEAAKKPGGRCRLRFVALRWRCRVPGLRRGASEGVHHLTKYATGGSGTTGSVSFDAKLTFLAAPERTRNALCHLMLVRCELPQLTAIKTNALPTSLPLSYVEWSVRDNVSDDIARQFLFDGEDGLDEARRRAKNRVSLLKIADRAAFETLPPRPHWCFEEGSKVTVHDSAASVRYSQNGNNQDHSISNCAHSFLLSTFLILQ